MKTKGTKQNVGQTTLNEFISALSSNIGFSLEKKTSKKDFNPFSVSNTEYVLGIYTLMNYYSQEKKNKNIIVPNEVEVTKSEKVAKFSFKKNLDLDIIENIIEEKELNNVDIKEDNSIEISKKSTTKK